MRRPVCVLVLALVVALTSQVSAQTTPEVLALLPVTDGVLFPGLSEEIQIAEIGRAHV